MKSAHDLVEQARTSIREVSMTEADAAIQAADVLIDVREPDEFREGHIDGALNIPRGVLEFKLSGTPELGARDLSVVLYCKTSGRAALAAAALQEMGYMNVKSIAGGFDAWVEAGKPAIKPSLPSFD
ncbi:rhodanese-like domain-containing protein [Pseudomonas stutzeri]|uniref:Sulfurtransferase n=1 Tax=Stutzerimonas stutzeri TaxID=316 RepID=A0A2N8S7D1_STUST|nr:rhodanese-like domain-containing protein [Stutzerimonas stutzeri]MCQ4294846.1 rhodanese-like domain-containing protein [Stutzerimonas stutzeri]PNF82531.1 sulfurtransferase [Stutzerimonas stutzeri]